MCAMTFHPYPQLFPELKGETRTRCTPGTRCLLGLTCKDEYACWDKWTSIRLVLALAWETSSAVDGNRLLFKTIKSPTFEADPAHKWTPTNNLHVMTHAAIKRFNQDLVEYLLDTTKNACVRTKQRVCPICLQLSVAFYAPGPRIVQAAVVAYTQDFPDIRLSLRAPNILTVQAIRQNNVPLLKWLNFHALLATDFDIEWDRDKALPAIRLASDEPALDWWDAFLYLHSLKLEEKAFFPLYAAFLASMVIRQWDIARITAFLVNKLIPEFYPGPSRGGAPGMLRYFAPDLFTAAIKHKNLDVLQYAWPIVSANSPIQFIRALRYLNTGDDAECTLGRCLHLHTHLVLGLVDVPQEVVDYVKRVGAFTQ